MITIKNIKTSEGSVKDLSLASQSDQVIDAQEQLLSLPTFIDSNTLFDPLVSLSDGNLIVRANTLITSGISATFFSRDLSAGTIGEQNNEIEAALQSANVPLRTYYYIDGTHPESFDKIGKSKAFAKGIKTSIDLLSIPFTGTGSHALDRIFQLAAQEDMIIVMDLNEDKKEPNHAKKRALEIIEQAISLTEKYSGQLCLQHVRTKEELTKIKAAKAMNLLVYAEMTYTDLFITEEDIENTSLKTTHSFLPSRSDQNALWEAINDGTIEMVGSGNVLISEEDPSLAATLFLPLMLRAYQEKKLTLETLIAITRVNAENIFRLPPNDDFVLVDLSLTRASFLENLHPQTLISILKKDTLTAWPVHVVAKSQLLTNELKK